MPSLNIESMIHGYHVYKNTWVPVVGEMLVYHREGHNFHDPFAVAVQKGTTVVGHVPRCISAMCYTFLGKDGCHITCTVTGHRRYSHDLPQGGMEIPCHIVFTAEVPTYVQKLRKLIFSLNVAQLLKTINILEASEEVDSEKPVKTEVEPNITTETVEDTVKSETVEYMHGVKNDAVDLEYSMKNETAPVEHSIKNETGMTVEAEETKLIAGQSDTDTDSDISLLEDNAADLTTVTVSTEALSSPQASICTRIENASQIYVNTKMISSSEASADTVIITSQPSKVKVNNQITNSSRAAIYAEIKAASPSIFYGGKVTSISSKKEPTGTSKVTQVQQKSQDVVWIKLGKSSLTKFHRAQIDRGDRLHDQHINHAQSIIRNQYSLKELQCTLLQKTRKPPLNELQRIHCRGNHWILASTILSVKNYVNVYDSLYDSIDEDTEQTIKFLFKDHLLKVNMVKVQKQRGIDDCGLFAIANAVQLAKKCNPS